MFHIMDTMRLLNVHNIFLSSSLGRLLQCLTMRIAGGPVLAAWCPACKVLICPRLSYHLLLHYRQGTGEQDIFTIYQTQLQSTQDERGDLVRGEVILTKIKKGSD